VLTNPTNTLVLQKQRKSGKCDYWCCLFAFPWLMVEQALYQQCIGDYHVSSTSPNRLEGVEKEIENSKMAAK
jgi:hypothetical protein